MTFATKLTLSRLLLVIPLLVILSTSQHVAAIEAAMTIFWVALGTDALDGIIARKYHQVTALGGFLDTLADKVLIHATIFLTPLLALYNPWIALGALSRDAFVEALRGHSAFQKKFLPANIWGKLKFGLQAISITCSLLALVCSPELRPRFVESANWLLASAVVVSLPGASILVVAWRSLITERISFFSQRKELPCDMAPAHTNKAST